MNNNNLFRTICKRIQLMNIKYKLTLQIHYAKKKQKRFDINFQAQRLWASIDLPFRTSQSHSSSSYEEKAINALHNQTAFRTNSTRHHCYNC